MSSDVYWLTRMMPGGEKLHRFELIHPEPSNGTDGTPQVLVRTYLNGERNCQAYEDLESARKLWYNSIGQGFVRVKVKQTKEKGMEISPWNIEI